MVRKKTLRTIISDKAKEVERWRSQYETQKAYNLYIMREMAILKEKLFQYEMNEWHQKLGDNEKDLIKKW
jgi:hypothetical protein